jgi:hypothetical protein
MAQYRVVVPLAIVELAVESGVGRREVYRNGVIDSASVTPEHLDHLIESGAVEEVGVVDLDAAIAQSAGAGDAANGSGSSSASDEPARNASRDEWAAFAATRGATEEELAELKRDELVEKFGTPSQ